MTDDARAELIHNTLARRLREQVFDVPNVPVPVPSSRPSPAIAAVLDAVMVEHRNPHLRESQIFQLAMQWPTLAAALGQLLAENEMPVPTPFRYAAREGQ